jgi:hypothetical protein
LRQVAVSHDAVIDYLVVKHYTRAKNWPQRNLREMNDQAGSSLAIRVYPRSVRLMFSEIIELIGLFANIALVVTVYLGYQSVRDGQTAHVSNMLSWAAAQMDDIKSDIRIIQESECTVGNWSERYRAAATRVSARYQRLGYMAYYGLINPVHFKRMWGLSFVILWRELEPFVKELRRNNGEPEDEENGAFSRIHFERMAKAYEKDYGKIVDRMTSKKDASLTLSRSV